MFIIIISGFWPGGITRVTSHGNSLTFSVCLLLLSLCCRGTLHGWEHTARLKLTSCHVLPLFSPPLEALSRAGGRARSLSAGLGVFMLNAFWPDLGTEMLLPSPAAWSHTVSLKLLSVSSACIQRGAWKTAPVPLWGQMAPAPALLSLSTFSSQSIFPHTTLSLRQTNTVRPPSTLELESRPRAAAGVWGGGGSPAMGVADVNPGALGPGSPPLSAPGDCFSVPAAATLSRV